jgi:hypothetical protein
MQVELLAVYSTLRRAYRPGERIDLPEADAIRLIERSLARPVRAANVETTSPVRGERAVKRNRAGTPKRKV